MLCFALLNFALHFALADEQAKQAKFIFATKAKMDQELGASKAEKWRQSGRLPTRPDCCTGSTEEDDIEYKCVFDTEEHSKEDSGFYRIDTSGDATEESLKLMDDASINRKAKGDKGEGDPEEEEKPPTEEDIMKLRIAELMDNPKPVLRQFQDYEIEAKAVQEKAPNNRYAGTLSEDNQKWLGRCKKVVAILNNILLGKGPKREASDAKSLIKSLDTLEKDYNTIMEWAGRFGLAQARKKQRVSRKTSQVE